MVLVSRWLVIHACGRDDRTDFLEHGRAVSAHDNTLWRFRSIRKSKVVREVTGIIYGRIVLGQFSNPEYLVIASPAALPGFDSAVPVWRSYCCFVRKNESDGRRLSVTHC